MSSEDSTALPSREISYNYCIAMFMAQQFENGLRYILDSADYYGLIDELEPTPAEKKQGKSTVELLDKATCGRLLHALKKRIPLPSEAHWKILSSALDDRNLLAHRFLIQFDYDGLTAAKEKKIVNTIYEIVLRLRMAVVIIRALRKSLDMRTDRIDTQNEQLLKSLGVELDFPRKKTQRRECR